MSLNPQLNGAKWDEWYAAQQWDAQSYWDYLNRRDLRSDLDGRAFQATDYYYPRFARALVTLTGAALGIPDPYSDEVAIAMRRMAFFEILPYASKSYVPRPADAVRLVRTDVGCQMATSAALGAIEHRQPAVVLVNGSDAVHVFEAVHGVAWAEHRYPSASSARPKTVRHFESVLTFPGHSVPVFGFPQLRGMSSHNSNAEVAQLAARIAEVVLG